MPNLEAEERKVPQRQRESKSHIALSLAKSLIEMRHCIELERERERERGRERVLNVNTDIPRVIWRGFRGSAHPE